MQRLVVSPVEFEDPNISVLANAVKRATVDPDWFCDTILCSPNDPWQSEMMNAIADLDRARLGLGTLYNHELLTRFTIVAFHGPGKTHFIAKLAHWWNFTRRGLIAATAPKEKQLKTRLWPEFRKVRNGALEYYRQLIKVDTTKVTWANDPDWCMLAEAASQPENLQGLHADWMCFLVDEASGVNEEMFPPIEGALTTPGAIEVLIGNPTRSTGEFWASHNKRGTMELYYRKAIKPEDSPRIDPKWVQGMIQKYGIGSPVVQIRVFGKFVEADERQLIPLAWIEDARDREHVDDGSLFTRRVAIDIADGGADETIIVFAELYETHMRLRTMSRHSFPASEAPIDSATAGMGVFDSVGGDPKNGDDIVVDALGVGSGTAGYIIKKEYPVIPYKGGKASDDQTQWINRRTQSYMVLRDMFRDGRITIDEGFAVGGDWDDFTAQLCSIKTDEGVDKVEKLEPKRKLTGRGIKSPDIADAVAMLCATQTPMHPAGSGGTHIEVIETNNSSGEDGALT